MAEIKKSVIVNKKFQRLHKRQISNAGNPPRSNKKDAKASIIIQYWDILKELLSPLGTAANLTSDAHLAALAIEYGARLFSTDNDFSRFASLRWTNPIEN